MPARANQRFDARSRELTKNLMTTRLQLENHFKSIKRREADFKRQKLVNIEEELKEKARMGRSTPSLEGNSLRKQGASPREQPRGSPSAAAKQRARSSDREQLTPLGRGAGQSLGLNRSYSSPGFLGSQYPAEWGGHGAMPKPPGSPAAFPLAVSRACADVPACQHPPPHPGSHSVKPAQTRSMASFANSHTAAFYTPATSTPAPMVGTPPSPGRRPLAERSVGKDTDDDFGIAAAGNDGENLIEKDPMIKRLGYFMALLGPRYKSCDKQMIWEKAERGDLTPFQRRLRKAGGIEAVGGGPDRSLRGGAVPSELSDSDGKARAAWLAARTSEKERRNQANRAARNKAPR